LDTLPGIGPTYAARIIDYRTAHGPFARIEDIQNVSGIGVSTYADIAPLITIGTTNVPASAPAVQATSTPTESVSTPAPPSALSVRISGSDEALVGVPLRLSARTNKASTQFSWSFGDGSSATGNVAEKTYRYAGTYLVVVTATDGSVSARDDLTVAVKPAVVSVAVATGEGIVIANDAALRLDLSGWRLLVDASSFRIPEGMMVLPKASVLLPYAITRLPMSSGVVLAYPDGVIAARSALAVPASGGQPSSVSASYEQVQEVEPPVVSKAEPIISTANIQAHAEAVGAPAAVLEGTAAGAALPPPIEGTRPTSLFRSPWTLSFIGLMALAGSAFIFL
ncbi:MAG: helix-hairpin-helix domain-containing protein, partial [Candidatus Pacebacteria bacterium]|nr:helix-hairpin-helix domain-containing protein [Candidatus Paceibacterota bacterium]